LASDAELRAAVNTATDSILRELVVSSLGRCQRSMVTIEAIRDDPDVAPYVRLGAAKALAEYGLRLIELVGMVDRLAAIEQELEVRVIRMEWGEP